MPSVELPSRSWAADRLLVQVPPDHLAYPRRPAEPLTLGCNLHLVLLVGLEASDGQGRRVGHRANVVRQALLLVWNDGDLDAGRLSGRSRGSAGPATTP